MPLRTYGPSEARNSHVGLLGLTGIRRNWAGEIGRSGSSWVLSGLRSCGAVDGAESGTAVVEQQVVGVNGGWGCNELGNTATDRTLPGP